MDTLPPKERMCHCAWFEKSCRDLVASGACGRWVPIQGAHPQTGEVMNRYDCIDNHVPVLLMNIGKGVHEAGASTDSLRNEIVEGRERAIRRIQSQQRIKTIEAAE